MEDKKQQDKKVAELEKLKQKNLPDNIKQSIAEKQQQVKTPFNK